MRTLIIVSKKDPAGMNIKEFLEREDLKKLNTELCVIEEDTIYANDIDKNIKADLFIFATRHQSAKKINSLSCHCPGNWDKAEAGGKNRKLCIAPAVLLKEAFTKLNELGKDLHHEITLEVTHHGPYLEKPCMFIEIGSDEENWKNKEAGKVITDVIIYLLKNINEIMDNKKKYEIAFGIGGLHYADTFNRRTLETDIAFGHICPRYMLEKLDKEIILEGMEKTFPKVDFVVLDWKGLGKEKQRIVSLLNELEIEYKRTDQL